MSGTVIVDENRLGVVEQELSGVKSDISHMQTDIGEIKSSQTSANEHLRVIGEAVVRLQAISEQNQLMIPKLEKEREERISGQNKAIEAVQKNKEWIARVGGGVAAILFIITMFAPQIRTLLFGSA